MSSIRKLLRALILIFAAGLAVALPVPAAAEDVPDLSALLGRWQIDPSLTRMGRFGPDGQNMVRSPTFTFIFARNGRNIDVNVYSEYPQPKPTRTMALIADGKPHACLDPAACLTAGGDAREQTYVYRALTPRFVVRLFYIKGKLSEYSTYGVSEDGQTFTMIAWSPETPHWQNIQVFRRQT